MTRLPGRANRVEHEMFDPPTMSPAVKPRSTQNRLRRKTNFARRLNPITPVQPSM
jgi:hypothetical protein